MFLADHNSELHRFTQSHIKSPTFHTLWTGNISPLGYLSYLPNVYHDSDSVGFSYFYKTRTEYTTKNLGLIFYKSFVFAKELGCKNICYMAFSNCDKFQL